MQLSIHTTYEEMSQKAAEAVLRLTAELTEPLICFPSGNTPVLFLKNLTDHFRSLEKTPDWYFIGLDEWVGIDPHEKGSCRQFMDEHFFIPLAIPENRIFFFDGNAADLDAECRKSEQWLDIRGNISITVLGLGRNGHLGLNEPGSDRSLRTQVTELSNTTQQSGQGYFDNPKELKKGFTLGLKTIFDSRTIFLLVNGKHKAEIVRKVLDEPETADIPATILKSHPDCWLYLDHEAADRTEKIS